MIRHLVRYAVVGIIISVFWHFVHNFGTLMPSVGPSLGQLHSVADSIHAPLATALKALAIPGLGSADVNAPIHYAPEENLENYDVALIQQSKGHLDVAMYALTDAVIGRAIVTLADSGVPVRIYRDHQQFQEEQRRRSYVAEMFRGHKNIQVRVKSSGVLMHLKAFSDGEFLRDGSANWSPSGEKQQDNSLTISRDKHTVTSFEKNYNEIWERSDNLVAQ